VIQKLREDYPLSEDGDADVWRQSNTRALTAIGNRNLCSFTQAQLCFRLSATSALHMILCTWSQADPAAICVDLVGCRALV